MRRILFVICVATAVCIFVFRSESKPRVLAISEVPVAYWAWMGNVPSQIDLSAALEATKSRTLFLRAGQFDVENGTIERIRPVGGVLPSGVELHLAYNATQRFLRDLDALDTGELSAEMLTTFTSDLARAHRDNAEVFGLQLDLDVPNRLLPKYGAVLREIRNQLPSNIKLSVTGLPTWTTTPDDLKAALAAVDFWIPQCYGGTVPTRLSQRIPIASATGVARTLAAVRRLGKPFYAGLAAYGYAILYSKEGELVEIRGNIDPAKIARHTGLELVDRRSFDGDASDETRYEYRATRDLVLDGLIISPAQTLVVDQPSSASLRATARAVRENAGELLLGISIFRLPSPKDDTVLTIDEITAALADTETKAISELKLETTRSRHVILSARNTGTAASLLGDDAFVIDLDISPGSLKDIADVSGFSAYDTLCHHDRDMTPVPCSTQRANVIRLRSRSWRQSNEATVKLELVPDLPGPLNATATTRVDDGRTSSQNFELTQKKDEEQNPKN